MVRALTDTVDMGNAPDLTGQTRLFFHIADPVAQVKAPMLFNTVLAKRGIDARLVPLHVAADALKDTFKVLAAAQNVGGLLVTMPHKQTIVLLAHDLGEQARLVGAANSVRFDNDQSIADMFDGLGLVRGAAERGIGITGRSVLLLGAGGAARAVAFALASAGAERLTVANRTARTAEALVDEVRTVFPALIVEVGGNQIVDQHDVVINATSLGMRRGDPSPIPVSGLQASTSVIDIVTVPGTALLTGAAARGCRTMDGSDMLRAMADAVIDFWVTGISPPSTLLG